MENTKNLNRSKTPKRGVKGRERTTSSGIGGKIPFAGRKRPVRTGGNPNRRNKKWSLKKLSDRIKITKDGNIDEPKELECYIYLDTNDEKIAKEFYKNFLNLLDKYDFGVSKENIAEKGSWFKRFWVKSKKAINSREVQERLEKLERGLELEHIDKKQSEVDLNTAQAISCLLDSTKDIENFTTRVGSLLFAKVTINGHSSIFAQTLTQEQLKIVKDNPSLMNRPIDLIAKMEFEKTKVLTEVKHKKLEGQ